MEHLHVLTETYRVDTSSSGHSIHKCPICQASNITRNHLLYHFKSNYIFQIVPENLQLGEKTQYQTAEEKLFLSKHEEYIDISASLLLTSAIFKERAWNHHFSNLLCILIKIIQSTVLGIQLKIKVGHHKQK